MNVPEARQAIDRAADRFEKALTEVIGEFRKQMVDIWSQLLEERPKERTAYREDEDR